MVEVVEEVVGCWLVPGRHFGPAYIPVGRRLQQQIISCIRHGSTLEQGLSFILILGGVGLCHTGLVKFAS
jgi:hypothetical protein